ncbi:diguanylate cyclase domain-containing protein [Pectinatus haikarae]|uniref:Diguanylate cyclase (GGDEF)-like protein n=1 Tax=Pectinatus haikarae TaxID=349096 RepID=A0ABT9Y4K8_9FIRM|nr:diguanylate cyclase [Pectinatus haikarae]MDQ0202440.1 diguanylate cyclase (GGDEF)-like protein [Pectinatus haikarae]
MKNHQQPTSHTAGMDNSTIWQIVPDLLLHMNADGVFLGYNQPQNMKLYLPPDEFINKNIKDLFSEYIADNAIKKIKKTLYTDTIRYFHYHIIIDGRKEYFEARFVKYNDNEVLVIIRDITDITNMKKKLDFLSNHDSLTKAFNRNYFDEVMSNFKKENRKSPFGLMICDIDSLKLINDSMGHSMGDKLIKSAAKILFSCLVEGDSLFRIGGDEFVIISIKQDMSELEKKIKQSIESYNKLYSNMYLSVSLGWQLFTDKNSIQKIFDSADNNMYKEKLYNTPIVREIIINNILSILEKADFLKYDNITLLKYLLKIYASKLHLSSSIIGQLDKLTTVHNIGLIGISKNTLAKKFLPSEKEQIELRRHCEIGFRILNMSTKYSDVADYILKHHENWDGSGYPLGLFGEEIPLICRIFRLADDFHAMLLMESPVSGQAYESLAAKIENASGSLYDPYLAANFLLTIKQNKDGILSVLKTETINKSAENDL